MENTKSDQQLLDYTEQSMRTLVKYGMAKVIGKKSDMVYDSRKLENTIEDCVKSGKWLADFLDTNENDHIFWSKTALDIIEKMNVKPTKQDMRGIYQGLSTVCILLSSDWIVGSDYQKQMAKTTGIKLPKAIVQRGYDKFNKMNKGFLSLCLE